MGMPRAPIWALLAALIQRPHRTLAVLSIDRPTAPRMLFSEDQRLPNAVTVEWAPPPVLSDTASPPQLTVEYSYELKHRKHFSGENWQSINLAFMESGDRRLPVLGTQVQIGGLASSVEYEIQLRARAEVLGADEGNITSAWS